MSSPSRWITARLALLLLLAGTSWSCVINTGHHSCRYAGEDYKVGERFSSIDGCNTCTCADDREVSCTNRACGNDGGVDASLSDGSAELPRDATPGDLTGGDGGDGGGDAGGDETPAMSCSLESSYRFFDDGGLRASYDDSRLAPPRAHTLTRKATDGALIGECRYDVPCAGGAAVDLPAIQQAIAHPDVQEALAKAQRPHYGADNRPVDGTVWMFERTDGRGFSLGGGNVPAGLRALETLLRKLVTETRAAPQCAALR
jgi:hypothetical protein